MKRVVCRRKRPRHEYDRKIADTCNAPFYYYTKKDAKRVKDAIAEGCGTDAPGSFIAWLCKRSPVHAMEMPGSRYDIGNLESYDAVMREYRGIKKC